MINAGMYNRRIKIYQTKVVEDDQGFQSMKKKLVICPFANVKTTKGFTIIKNNSDFEKALTNFTIRYPRNTEITRDMIIEFRGKTYTIVYLNNIDEASVQLEIQAKLIEK